MTSRRTFIAAITAYVAMRPAFAAPAPEIDVYLSPT